MPTPTPAAISSGPASQSAVQIRAGNACGSGWLAGRGDDGAAYFFSNAHVCGTRPGTVVEIHASINGSRRTFPASIVAAAYSNRYLTDWACVRTPNWPHLNPCKLHAKRPLGGHYTRGAPRCTWPLVDSDIFTVEISDGSPLWRWRPNSIPGQSGSLIVSDLDHLAEGILTWTWGGLGAGQQCFWIRKQAEERSAEIGPLRIDGLIEVVEGTRAETDDGFFAETADILDLPIWWTDDGPPTQPPPPDDSLQRWIQAYTDAQSRIIAVMAEENAKLKNLRLDDAGQYAPGNFPGL